MVNKQERPFGYAVELAQSKNIKMRTSESLNWYRQYTQNQLSQFNTWDSVKRQGEILLAKQVVFGGIYTFVYSPKHKDTLPYYDSTPLIIPFKDEGKSFLAFNLHYLPFKHRAIILDSLYKISNDTTSPKRKLNAKYELIMQLGKSELFKPCIKKYLKSHMKSRLLEFKPEHWEISIFLPIASFHKMNEKAVHAQSLKSIYKRRRGK